jgi:hypothetical protein
VEVDEVGPVGHKIGPREPRGNAECQHRRRQRDECPARDDGGSFCLNPSDSSERSPHAFTSVTVE